MGVSPDEAGFVWLATATRLWVMSPRAAESGPFEPGPGDHGRHRHAMHLSFECHIWLPFLRDAHTCIRALLSFCVEMTVPPRARSWPLRQADGQRGGPGVAAGPRAGWPRFWTGRGAGLAADEPVIKSIMC